MRKSVKLTETEKKELKSFRKKYSSSDECAKKLGVTRCVLERTLLTGSTSGKSYSIIYKNSNLYAVSKNN